MLNLQKVHNYHPVCNVTPPTEHWNLVPIELQYVFRNVPAKSITMPSRAVVGQLQHTKRVPNDQASKLQDKQGPTRGKGGLWVLDQLNLEGLDSWDTRTTGISQKSFG